MPSSFGRLCADPVVLIGPSPQQPLIADAISFYKRTFRVSTRDISEHPHPAPGAHSPLNGMWGCQAQFCLSERLRWFSCSHGRSTGDTRRKKLGLREECVGSGWQGFEEWNSREESRGGQLCSGAGWGGGSKKPRKCQHLGALKTEDLRPN